MNNTELLDKQILNSFKKDLDVFFLVFMGCLVLFLQPGFSFYESGMVRRKNVVNAASRNIVNIIISFLAYFLTGFALAFGDGNAFCGWSYFGLVGLPDDMLAQCFFQYTFAAVASSIPSGVVHERCSTVAYVSYTALISGFLYPIATHWIAVDAGWLHVLGFDDFAFSGVVHAMGGASSLVIVYMTGPRLDRVPLSKSIPPHSIPQVVLGCFIFLFGMVAFNAGSQGAISRPGDGMEIAKVSINSLICTMSGGLTALLYDRYAVEGNRTKNWNYSSCITGTFVGMVTICAGCDQFPFWASFVVGVLSYFFYRMILHGVEKLKVDDAVDSIAVQIGGGYFGVLIVPFFKENGFLTNPCKSTAWDVLINCIGGIVIMAWPCIFMIPLYFVLRRFGLHRVSPTFEKMGLDLAIHKMVAYGDLMVDDTQLDTPILYQGGFRRIPIGYRRAHRKNNTVRAWTIVQ